MPQIKPNPNDDFHYEHDIRYKIANDLSDEDVEALGKINDNFQNYSVDVYNDLKSYEDGEVEEPEDSYENIIDGLKDRINSDNPKMNQVVEEMVDTSIQSTEQNNPNNWQSTDDGLKVIGDSLDQVNDYYRPYWQSKDEMETYKKNREVDPVEYQMENQDFVENYHDEIEDQMNKDGMLKLYGNDLDTFYTQHQTDISERQAFEHNNPGKEVPASMKVAKLDYSEALAEDPDSPEAEAVAQAEPEDMVVNMDSVMNVYNKYMNPIGEPLEGGQVRPVKLGYDGHGEARTHQAQAERFHGENTYGDEAEAKAHPEPEMPADVKAVVDEISPSEETFDLDLSDLEDAQDNGLKK